MGRPQPGQKAAVSGISAAQCGHDNGRAVSGSMVGTISKLGAGSKWVELIHDALLALKTGAIELRSEQPAVIPIWRIRNQTH
jgi:hypothetical protein